MAALSEGPGGPPAPEPPARERPPLWPTAEEAAASPFVFARFPPGHFYSPLPDTRELAAEPRRSAVWPEYPRDTPGIDWRDDAQVALCQEVFAVQKRLEFASAATEDPTEYYATNDQYPGFDAWVLEGFLRHLQPSRMVEIGSGFSTLVSARVNRELLGETMSLTCIEPYPRQFLRDGLRGVSELRVETVQESPPSLFQGLGQDDILFIDSSHVAKTGSDVVWLFQEIVPSLRPGVLVHVHDVFAPGDYPEPWVLDGWAWNELYVLRAFLAFNSAFQIEFGSQYMLHRHRDLLEATFAAAFDGRHGGLGSSLWFRRGA